MISVRHRFHGYGSIKGVYQHGHTVREPLMNLKYTRRKKSGYRVAVVVSRKVHKSAVIRNRIRRRLYEIIRTAEPALVDGKDMVFTVFSEKAAELPSPQLHSSVNKLLHKSAQPVSEGDTPKRHAIVKPEGKI